MHERIILGLLCHPQVWLIMMISDEAQWKAEASCWDSLASQTTCGTSMKGWPGAEGHCIILTWSQTRLSSQCFLFQADLSGELGWLAWTKVQVDYFPGTSDQLQDGEKTRQVRSALIKKRGMHRLCPHLTFRSSFFKLNDVTCWLKRARLNCSISLRRGLWHSVGGSCTWQAHFLSL